MENKQNEENLRRKFNEFISNPVVQIIIIVAGLLGGIVAIHYFIENNNYRILIDYLIIAIFLNVSIYIFYRNSFHYFLFSSIYTFFVLFINLLFFLLFKFNKKIDDEIINYELIKSNDFWCSLVIILMGLIFVNLFTCVYKLNFRIFRLKKNIEVIQKNNSRLKEIEKKYNNLIS